MELMEYIDRGGVIVYILIALNVIGWSLMIYKFVEYLLLRSKISNIAQRLKASTKSLDEWILDRERGLSTIKIIASIAPLLGLLGTVVGVLNAFDKISQKGLNDPSIFANGISVALITTVAGLVVAIPHYIGYNYLIAMLDRIEVRVSDVLKRES